MHTFLFPDIYCGFHNLCYTAAADGEAAAAFAATSCTTASHLSEKQQRKRDEGTRRRERERSESELWEKITRFLFFHFLLFLSPSFPLPFHPYEKVSARVRTMEKGGRVLRRR